MLITLALALLALGALRGGAQAQTTNTSFFPLVAQPASAPEPTISPASPVQISQIVCRGAGQPLNAEYLVIANTSAKAVVLSGWTITNVTQAQTFSFPGFTIKGAPGATIAIYGGAGAAQPNLGVFFWGNTVPVWHLGDTVRLRDAAGHLISSLTASVSGCPFIPPTTPKAPASIRINDVVCRKPTDDPTFEYIELVNKGSSEIEISGWKAVNITQGNISYTFPSYTFPAGPDVYVVIYGGIGTNRLDIGEFYWGTNTQVWHLGDQVELLDAAGNQVTTFTVPANSCS
jgi:hypothetical protein